MSSLLKKIIRRLWPSIAAALLAGIIFVIYLQFVGIPKTQARELYNQAQAARTGGDDHAYRTLLQEAYAAWPESYIGEELGAR